MSHNSSVVEVSFLVSIHNCSHGNHKFFFAGPSKSLNVAFQPKANFQNDSPDIIQTMTFKRGKSEKNDPEILEIKAKYKINDK